jgi:hypothetical protein
VLADSYTVARNCSDPAIAPLVGPYCMSVPVSKAFPADAPALLVERAYLDAEAKTGPAYEELLMPIGFSVQL